MFSELFGKGRQFLSAAAATVGMNSLALTSFGPVALNLGAAIPATAPAPRDAAGDLPPALRAAIQKLVESAGIILNPPPIRSADAAPMDITSNPNLNSLLSGALAQGNLKQLPAELLGRPQVLEAVVLSHAPLTGAAPRADAPSPVYRIAVLWQGRTLQLLSSQPPATGSRVQLQINARGEVSLLSTTAPAAPTPRILPDNLGKTALALQMALRENLPQAEPLHKLVPLLERLDNPPLAQQIPEPLAKSIGRLLQSLPRPEQLQNTESLKRALVDSGALLEARLRRGAAPPTGAEVAKIVDGDLKAQIVQLLALLRRLGFAAPTPAKAPLPGADGETLVYSARPVHAAAAQPARAENADSADALLEQLGKLLAGGLARIQVNQLEGAGARHLNSADNPQPVPTWVFELPLQTPRGGDNLQLRIEQRRQQHEGRTRSQWTVNIGFDLHELGKLAATLTIVERSVAATLWSEREHTHRAVRREIDHLRAGLEQAGVKVTEVQCRLGLPPPRNSPVSQQLVDVLT